MHRLPLAAVAATTFALAGCADSQAPGAPDSPQFNFANAPSQSGAVYRFEDYYTFRIVDAEAGLDAWHGVNWSEWCQGNGGIDVAAFQVVQKPQEADRFSQNTQGDLYTTVFALGSDYCSDAPLASGVSNARYVDNDVTPYLRPGSRNHNAYGYMANGTLADADGNSVRYAGTFRGNWDGNDPASARNHSKITLR